MKSWTKLLTFCSATFFSQQIRTRILIDSYSGDLPTTPPLLPIVMAHIQTFYCNLKFFETGFFWSNERKSKEFFYWKSAEKNWMHFLVCVYVCWNNSMFLYLSVFCICVFIYFLCLCISMCLYFCVWNFVTLYACMLVCL